MKKLTRFYQLANCLSFDVAAGAIVSALFFARILQVHILPWGFAALGLTVWIIYTGDHLLDARQLNAAASSDRHRFHQKHFRTLLFALLAALLIDMVMIFLIRKPVFNAGLVLGVMAGIYLLIQRNLKSLKELSGAMLYCSGVALPALSLTPYPITPFQGLFIVQFGITVFCNLLLFSLFDHQDDLRDRHNSFVTVMGEQKTRLFLAFLFIVNGILIVHQLFRFSGTAGAASVMLVMNFILFFIFIFPRFFEANGFYRLLGDAVFLVPLFFLLM